MAEMRGAISGARQGRNGRLFLESQDGFDLEKFSKGTCFNPAMLHFWRQTLIRRGRDCAERGIPYVFFLVPDAPSVYPEDLPDDLGIGLRPPGEMFLEAMGEIEGVTFVYPLQGLLDAKGGLEIYQKNDTHWTSYGAYVGYRTLMRTLEGLVPCQVVPARDVSFAFRRSYGDLGSLMQPEQVQEIPAVRIAGPEMSSAVQFEGVGRQTATESSFADSGSPSRAIVFRDSFFTEMAPFLARSFKHLLTIGTTTRVMMDVVESWKADVVISQVAERKILYHETDHQLEGYDTLYRAVYGSPAGKRLLQARIILASDPAGARSLIGNDGDQYEAHPEQAFSAALIHEANGDFPAAETLAQAALVARPGHPSFLALAARISLGCGNVGRACEQAAEAASAAPYNGYFQELFAYCLVQESQPQRALSVIEAALQRSPDHANLWYWASVLHDALANPRLAALSIVEAIKLNPEQPQYREQAAKLERAVVPA
jgi:hypothetical protein